MFLQEKLSSDSHLIIIPSYNSGAKLLDTLLAAFEHWRPIWVIIDASTDNSGTQAHALAAKHEAIKVTVLQKNRGKGGAVLSAMEEAAMEGYTHALVMDADGQHPVSEIQNFMQLSNENPEAMILGVPIFGADAPFERVKGRKVGNWFANLETWWGGIEDSLFGFRVYPLAPSLRILKSIRTARRFDFDTELAVRLYWDGVPPINRKVPVYYPTTQEGGITNFHYLRDNFLLIGTHIRLCIEMLFRVFQLLSLRKRRQ